MHPHLSHMSESDSQLLFAIYISYNGVTAAWCGLRCRLYVCGASGSACHVGWSDVFVGQNANIDAN